MNTGSRSTYLWLTLILLGSAALYFTGLGHGLPHLVGTDEGFEIHRALRLGQGEFVFDRVWKGGFFYVLFLLYGLYFAWSFVTGAVASPGEFASMFAQDLTPFWMIARVATVLVALGIVLATFTLGRRLYGSRAGLIGAAFTGVSLRIVMSTHFVNVDLAMTLLVLLTVHQLSRWADPEERPRPVLLGLAAGGALLCKIVAGVLVVPIVVAHLLRHRGAVRAGLRDRRIWYAALVVLAVNLAGNPGLLVAFGSAFSRITGTLGGEPSWGNAGGSGTPMNLWSFYAGALTEGLGLPMMIVAAAWLVAAIVRRERSDVLLLATTVPFVLLITAPSGSDLYYERYVIPIVPLLAIAGGDALARTAGRLRLPAPVLAGTVMVLLVLPVLHTLDWLVPYARGDTRIATLEWFEENVPAGEGVYVVGNSTVRTALTVPLRNLDENVEATAKELEAEDPSKAEVLRKRIRHAQGVPYDLRSSRHFEPTEPLDVYAKQGVRYFVLLCRHFRDAVADERHTGEVRDSRAALYRSLLESGRARKVFEIDPEEQRFYGPAIEVFRLENPER